ncbi:BCCIP family protein [Thraustotheca clavata]|uniref:BCCIP family protein n=1 Tax=Thraustotheca clavata TaxID=74557 RepID=A0A1W0AAP0_9STRA|nr:BCCIP family protein [Thraustotheca clavata]
MSKRQLDENDSMGESSEDEQDNLTLGANGDANEIVEVDFVFTDPCEANFHSVKQHLVQFLPASKLDTSNLANLIVGQVAVGSMVCAEGETDVFGLITALNLKRYGAEPSIQQIVSLVSSKCPDASRQRFEQILANHNVGLVVSRRLINLPYQLVPHLHSALQQDIDWAIENEQNPGIKESYKFEYFLFLAGVQVEKQTKKAPAGKKAKASAYTDPAIKTYDNFEDEFLEQEADIAFTFPTKNELKEGAGINTEISAFLIKRQKHNASLASIAQMLNI